MSNAMKKAFVVALILLVLFLWFESRAVNRYSMITSFFDVPFRGVYIIDTKTDQRWLDVLEGDHHAIIDFGTPQKPKFKQISFATKFEPFVVSEANE
jgi:hypothetical protein